MQMHPSPFLFYCVRPFSTTRTISLSIFLASFSRDPESFFSFLSLFLSKKQMDSSARVLLLGILFTAAMQRINRTEIRSSLVRLSISNHRAPLLLLSVILHPRNFNNNNNIQLDVLSRHLLRPISSHYLLNNNLKNGDPSRCVISSPSIMRVKNVAPSFNFPSLRCNATINLVPGKRTVWKGIIMRKKDDSRASYSVKNSNFHRIWRDESLDFKKGGGGFRGIWKSDFEDISARR